MKHKLNRHLQRQLSKYTSMPKKWYLSGHNRYRLLVYLSFTLIGLSMLWQPTVYLVFVCLIPLLFYLSYLTKYSPKTILKDFYLAGILAGLLSNLFLLQLEPTNWSVALSGWFGTFIQLSAWILAAGVTALGYLLIGWGLNYTSRSKLRLVTPVTVLPVLFVLAEIAKSYLFALGSYGPGASLSPNFNWGSMAVPAAGTPLVYSSRLVGFFGLSFLVICINIAIYYAIKKKPQISLIIVFGVGLVSLIGWNQGKAIQESGKMVNVSAVHLSPESDVEMFDKSSWPPEGTDIIVLPEYSALLEYPDYKSLLGRLSESGVAITTVSEGTSPDARNRTIYLNRQAEIIFEQDKTFLIPTGEYLPYSLQTVAKLAGNEKIMEDFRYSQQLTPGDQPEQVFKYKNSPNSGALACSGISALNQYRRLTDQGAEVLTNSASLSFLKPNSQYHTYAFNMARFQAVYNNRPLIQAMRSGRSFILDNQGNVLTTSKTQDNKLLVAQFRL